MTIKQIAELAGVSASTVSRIINSPDNSFASKEVRERVWNTIREHEYVPNPNARNLKHSSASPPKRISIVCCVLGRVNTLGENPFFEQIADVVKQHSLNMEVVVSNVLVSNAEATTFDAQADFGNAVVFGRIKERQIKAIERQWKNVVYVGRNPIEASFDQVICDGGEATKKAMGLLLQQGHKHIAYFGETDKEIRYQAYSEVMKESGAGRDSMFVCDVPHTEEGGYLAAERLISQGGPLPTAVCCASDSVAIAAMRRFRESKIKIPKDVSIVGMDNIESSGYVTPMLTTVEMPAVEMGTMAVNILLDRIHKGHKLPVKVILPSKLVERESVCPRTRP